MIIFILLFHLYLLTNTQFTAWPEMFSYPYLFNHGFLLYKDIAHVYQPLLTLTLSLVFKIFGYRLITLKIFTWTIILINDALLYKILKSFISNHKSIIVSILIYVLAQTVFEGNMLWFDLAITPLLLGLVHLLCSKSAFTNLRLFFAGLLLALCVLVKQQSILVAIPVGGLLLSRKLGMPRWLLFILGGILPVAGNFIWLIRQGVFSEYLFWTLTFPLKWLPQFPSYPSFPPPSQWLIVILLFTPIMISLYKRNHIFLGLLFIFLIGSAFPRFSYFHLQPALAVYIVIVATLLSVSRFRFIVLLIVMCTVGLLTNSIKLGNLASARFYEKSDLKLANYISHVTDPSDKVYLLGPHSLLYVLANRIPAKPWIDNYVWHFEIPGVQQQQILAWEKDPPAFVFRTPPLLGRWDQLGVYQPQFILNYLFSHYNKINQTSEGIEVWSLL